MDNQICEIISKLINCWKKNERDTIAELQINCSSYHQVKKKSSSNARTLKANQHEKWSESSSYIKIMSHSTPYQCQIRMAREC